jgi:hypothetical protein
VLGFKCLTYLDNREYVLKVPPSPSLSARKMIKMYLIVTINTRDQMISDSAPIRSARFGSSVNTDQDVFDGHHQRDGPENQRQNAQQIDSAGSLRKGRRENIERRRADVAIDYTGGLVRENEYLCKAECLQFVSVKFGAQTEIPT